MTRLRRLRTEARAAAEWRGHILGRFTPAEPNGWGGVTSRAVCSCGREAYVDTRPPPNGIDVAGEAVALDHDDAPECPECGREVFADPAGNTRCPCTD